MRNCTQGRPDLRHSRVYTFVMEETSYPRLRLNMAHRGEGTIASLSEQIVAACNVNLRLSYRN